MEVKMAIISSFVTVNCGTQGNDTITGGSGNDILKWLSHNLTAPSRFAAPENYQCHAMSKRTYKVIITIKLP